MKKFIFFVFFIFIFSKYSFAAITYDTSASGSCSGSGCSTDITVEMTITSESNRILILSLRQTVVEPNSIKYNGVSLTKLTEQIIQGTNEIHLWYLLNPDSGAHNIVLDTDSGGTVDFVAISLYGVKQIAPEAYDSSNTGGDSTTISDTLTTITNGAWLISNLASDAYTRTFTPTSGQTERIEVSTHAIGTEEIATAGTETVSWSINVANDIGMIMTSIAPFGETTTTQIKPQIIE